MLRRSESQCQVCTTSRNNFKDFNGFNMKAEARIWPCSLDSGRILNGLDLYHKSMSGDYLSQPYLSWNTCLGLPVSTLPVWAYLPGNYLPGFTFLGLPVPPSPVWDHLPDNRLSGATSLDLACLVLTQYQALTPRQDCVAVSVDQSTLAGWTCGTHVLALATCVHI